MFCKVTDAFVLKYIFMFVSVFSVMRTQMQTAWKMGASKVRRNQVLRFFPGMETIPKPTATQKENEMTEKTLSVKPTGFTGVNMRTGQGVDGKQ